MTFRSPLAAVSATLLLVLPAAAQETVHLRGEIQSVTNDIISIETVDGSTFDVAMADPFTVLVYEAITVQELGPGDFLSIPSIEEDGQKFAVSINVFPEALRGTGEGERAWDLTEQSLMTNATIGEVVVAQDGRVLVVEYDGIEEPVLVPADTPITQFAPDPDRKLAAGDQAILFVSPDEDGNPVADIAGVGADGGLPPI